MMNPLVLTPLIRLALERAPIEGLPKHLAAGSGMTQVGNRLHVIADDALDMAIFDCDTKAPGRLFTLFDRPTLPADHKERKKLKPDLESACLLQHQGSQFWLAVGSGSTENRSTGVCVLLDAEGEPKKAVEFDLAPLYAELKNRYPELNIEGTAPIVEEGRLRLAQRGNGTRLDNALIDLDLDKAFTAAREGKSWGPEMIVASQPVTLPTLPGSNGPVPLTITDLAPLDGGRCMFTAAAEDTDNPYDDGAILGSCIGVVELDGTVSLLREVDQKVKLEGISVRPKDGGVEALVVTDADDPDCSATVYQTWLTTR
ncbi:hypothetical protein IV102_03565 [bacterium]|nr:hypothetical protein [bacterium]